MYDLSRDHQKRKKPPEGKYEQETESKGIDNQLARIQFIQPLHIH